MRPLRQKRRTLATVMVESLQITGAVMFRTSLCLVYMTAACLLPDVLDGSKRSATAVCLCFATTNGD